MSLTNYITQSIAGAIIYFPFGFYLAPYCGYTLSLLVGFVLFLLQVQFCKWWLKGHKQGPLESLWHKWTWMYSKKIRNSGQELHMLYGREEKAKSNLSFPLFRIGTDSCFPSFPNIIKRISVQDYNQLFAFYLNLNCLSCTLQTFYKNRKMIGLLHQLTYNFLFFCAPRFISTWESFTLFMDIRWKDCFLNA